LYAYIIILSSYIRHWNYKIFFAKFSIEFVWIQTKCDTVKTFLISLALLKTKTNLLHTVFMQIYKVRNLSEFVFPLTTFKLSISSNVNYYFYKH